MLIAINTVAATKKTLLSFIVIAVAAKITIREVIVSFSLASVSLNSINLRMFKNKTIWIIVEATSGFGDETVDADIIYKTAGEIKITASL